MGLASLVGATQVGLHRIKWSELTAFARDCWNLGRWVLMGNLTNLVSDTLFQWNFAFWAGKELLGVFGAIGNVLRLVNPLSFAIATLITPNAARAKRDEGMHRAKRVLHRFGALGGLMLLPYLGTVFVAPNLSIAIFYGWDSPYQQYTLILQLAVIAMVLGYASTAAGAFLNAVERSRSSFVAQLFCAIWFVVVAMPLTAMYGLMGATIGWLLAFVVEAAVHLYYVARLPTDASDPAQPTAAESPQLQIAALRN
jgi:O-antigen/teichoic acid export membrane protein